MPYTRRNLLLLQALCLLTGGTVYSQPRFEVVSVKPGGAVFSTRPKRSGGRITWTSQLCYFIGYAYNLDFSLVSGLKIGSVYAIEATFDPAATDDQVRQMFQSLLADRFKMRSHRVTTEVSGLALSIGKGGAKIKPVDPDSDPPPLPEWVKNPTASLKLESYLSATVPEPGIIAITGRRVPLSQLAETLQRASSMPVWDRTGLAGNYYFAFRFAHDLTPDFKADAPSLGTALQETLGLKLEKQKGPLETLVIDSIEEPSEN